jgi:hypothetical protein
MNKKTTYTILKNDLIDRLIKCRPSDISIQLDEDETAIEGNYSSSEYRYQNGQFIQLTMQEKPFLPTVFKPNNEIITDIIKQLYESGFNISMHTETYATKMVMKQAIDQAAGRTRSRFVSPGNMIGEEYEQALRQAIVCVNSSGATVPPMTQTWANALNETPVNAAMNILETAAQWEYILNVTYDIRLSGKAAVDAASLENFRAVALIYINQLDQIQ